MAKFLRDLVRGVSRSSDQWPQIAMQQRAMRLQQEGVARQELEGKRSRLMALLNVAMASNNPEATAAGLAAMKQSGLFPELDALGGPAPSVAAPGPSSATPALPPLPALSGPPGRTMTMEDTEPQLTPGFAGESVASRIVPPQAPQAAPAGGSFFDAITAGVAEKKRLKVEDEQRKVNADARAERLERLRLQTEDRIARHQQRSDERLESQRYLPQVSGGTIFRLNPTTSQIEVTGQIQTHQMDIAQSMKLSGIIERLSKATDKTPAALMSAFDIETMAGSIPISPELRAQVKANFDQNKLDVTKHIPAADQTKMRDFNTAQDIAKGGLQQLSAIPPEQAQAMFGPLQGTMTELREKYLQNNTPAKANQLALEEIAQTPGIDQNTRNFLGTMAQLFEFFARPQTGAAISADEEGRFNNIVGSINMDPQAIQSRLYQMVKLADTVRRNIMGTALDVKYSGDPKEAKRLKGTHLPDYDLDPEQYMPYLNDQMIGELLSVPGGAEMYPEAVEEYRRRKAQGGKR